MTEILSEDWKLIFTYYDLEQPDVIQLTEDIAVALDRPKIHCAVTLCRAMKSLEGSEAGLRENFGIILQEGQSAFDVCYKMFHNDRPGGL